MTIRTIADVMTRGVHWIAPERSVIEAAQLMDELDVGVLPVYDDNTLLGLLTDRDIVLRAVARNRVSESVTVKDLMSHEVLWCYEDEPIEDVLDDMIRRQIRRLPVMNRLKQLIGIVSLGDIAAKTNSTGIGRALGEISLPAAPAHVAPRRDNQPLPEVVNNDQAEVNLGRK